MFSLYFLCFGASWFLKNFQVSKCGHIIAAWKGHIISYLLRKTVTNHVLNYSKTGNRSNSNKELRSQNTDNVKFWVVLVHLHSRLHTCNIPEWLRAALVSLGKDIIWSGKKLCNNKNLYQNSVEINIKLSLLYVQFKFSVQCKTLKIPWSSLP